MFSFHKPRVYRSSEGCCICRAKSSSSRFTDCRKYESDLEQCFNLEHPRHGEICNACVLLVKRYKRLPVGSTHHWGHVVDARAGPGTKSIIKYKKYRDDAAAQLDDQPSTSAAAAAAAAANASSNNTSSKSLIPEKFSKIFKKTKKNKTSGAGASTTTAQTTTNNCITGAPSTNVLKREGGVKRKAALAANAAWESTANSASLPSTPDSMDSDYEDGCRILTATPSSATNGNSKTIVDFQTETRLSSYRSRNTAPIAVAAVNVAATNSIAQRKARPPIKIGSKRRRRLSPRKNRRILTVFDETVPFFDSDEGKGEWLQRKSCCGLVYECKALGGALLLDLADYKRCAAHAAENKQRLLLPPPPVVPKTTIIATLPAVVQLAPPAAVVPTPTQVLKKHHLFFKRQSECFPQGDLLIDSNTTTVTATATTNSLKTDHSTTATTTTNKAAILNGNLAHASTSSSSFSTPNSSASTSSASTSSAAYHNLLSRQSAAKFTTISSLNSAISPQSSLFHPQAKISCINTVVVPLQNKTSHNFFNKIRTDTSKVLKNSIDKLNNRDVPGPPSATELQEMRNVIAANTGATSTQQQQQQLQPPLHTPESLLQPIPTNMAHPLMKLSATSPSANKFSDNSSDSGFDENMLDRKSASPLQDDFDPRMPLKVIDPRGVDLSHIRTLYLYNGVKVTGDLASLKLAGNQAAERFFANREKFVAERKAAMNAAADAAAANAADANAADANAADANAAEANAAANAADANIATTSRGSSSSCGSKTKSGAVKITQIGGSHSSSKMRIIYNSNAIQHENGVTTIVPASSLAATSQTAAMNALTAPSTVTITPAPVKKQKLPNQATQQHTNHHTINGNPNQKVVLGKSAAAKYNPNNSTISGSGVCMPSTSAAALNNLKNGL